MKEIKKGKGEFVKTEQEKQEIKSWRNRKKKIGTISKMELNKKRIEYLKKIVEEQKKKLKLIDNAAFLEE